MLKAVKAKKDAEIAVTPGTRWCSEVPGMSILYRPPSSPICKEDWEKYGKGIFPILREKFPDLYFAGMVKLAQIVRIEADVQHAITKPRTVAEVLAQVADRAGWQASVRGFSARDGEDQGRD
jgi:hypothetical protein